MILGLIIKYMVSLVAALTQISVLYFSNFSACQPTYCHMSWECESLLYRSRLRTRWTITRIQGTLHSDPDPRGWGWSRTGALCQTSLQVSGDDFLNMKNRRIRTVPAPSKKKVPECRPVPSCSLICVWAITGAELVYEVEVSNGRHLLSLEKARKTSTISIHVYTKPVKSVFHMLWLANSRYIHWISTMYWFEKQNKRAHE